MNNTLIAPELEIFPNRYRWTVAKCYEMAAEGHISGRYEIAEYWVLDLNARQLHIHREPADGKYTIITIHTETETVALISHPNAPVDVADLLPPVTF